MVTTHRSKDGGDMDAGGISVRRLDGAERDRLDAVAWLPPIGPFRAFGRSWTLTSDDPGVLALIADRYADLLAPGQGADGASAAADPSHAAFRLGKPAPDAGGMLVRGDDAIGVAEELGTLIGWLVWAINRWVLDTAAGERLVLHAGGVVGPDGGAVVLPAVSGAGKSTLTMGLLERGWGYLSDEAIALSPQRSVTGYAKPLSVDPGAWPLFERHAPQPTERPLQTGQWQVRASAVSWVASTAPLTVIVFPTYEPGAATTLTAVGPARKLRLAANATFAANGGERITTAQLRALASAIEAVPAYTLVSSRLDEACAAIEQAAAS